MYGMAVCLDMNPSVQAALTCLCCKTIIRALLVLLYPNLCSAPYLVHSYCMLFCNSAGTIAYSAAVVPTHPPTVCLHT